jgi:ankyrin repeat protein
MAAAALGKIELVKKLIDLGAKVNDENDKGADALYSATCAGRLDVVELLLASGADVNAKGGKHRNALNAASAEGYLDIVQTLLAAGADPQANDESYGNCLQAAAYHGHKDIVRVLAAAGVDVNEEGGIRGTALVNAAYSRDTEMIDLLVELGAPSDNIQDVLDAIVVATSKQDETLIRHILKLGAELDELGTIGFEDWTALAMAASKGNQMLVEMFLGLGADVNADAGVHHTALIAAIDTEYCNHDVLKRLITAGANVNEKSDEGEEKYAGTALIAAVRRADVKAITTLLDHGADPNLLNGYLNSPLMEAVNKRDEAVVDLLIEKGADVNLTVDPSEDLADFDTNYGASTALEVAAGEGYVALIHRLVKAGALLEQPRDDTAFKSALQCAAYYEEDEAVTVLLELGSDVNVVGGVWGSVLQAAVCSGSDTIVKLILDAGANINEHHVGKVITTYLDP